ncbi:legumain-like [Eriocheir sinensis]|uniref:legumain-like n=1 Tax=Eriocheir sinensis TaxID=95602 RepID=UPI0021C9843B|nr:legumain-like [Eriocheir sinensis]
MTRVGMALWVLAAACVLGGASAVPLFEEKSGDLWAVLVAGSYTWMNYRHQADVCHAYQILHQHGVPDDHIIVMMYDDIANNRDNPTPGVITNRPDGPDVYGGVPKDYTGKDVTPENFLKVLQGDAEGLRGVGSGKVLQSGPNDRVFINLVDHGAPGIFGFPTTFLHVDDFMNGILSMHKNKQFNELLIYLESCESGSMFKALPDDINVYAVSAANATESSYACYFDNKLYTFLGDVFSIKWMEDTDREDVTKETLEKQFELVKEETTTSHVLQWGQTSLASKKVSAFVGSKQTNASSTYGPFEDVDDPCLKSSVSSPDVPLASLLHKQEEAEDDLIGVDYWKGQVEELQENRTFVEDKMAKIARAVTGDDELANKMMTDSHHEIHNVQCHKKATSAWHDLCFDLAQNPYGLRLVHVVVNLCEHGFSATDFTIAARAVCTHDPVNGIV